jgi:pilus assembly protein CpaF
MAGVGLPHDAIREQLGRGLDLVIHLARLSDGSRRVVEAAEVVRTAGSVGVRALFRLGGDRQGMKWARRH